MWEGKRVLEGVGGQVPYREARSHDKTLAAVEMGGTTVVTHGQPIPSNLGQQTHATCNRTPVQTTHTDLEYPSFAYAPWPCSKGSANFVMKWKESKREASISVTTIKGLVRDVTGKQDCRGRARAGY